MSELFPSPSTSSALPSSVSVILVSWNCRALLLEALASITEVDGAGLEVIVVDNASEDGSPEAVEKHFPHARVIRTGANLGFAGGVNRGLRVVTSPWILLLNPDARISREAIHTLLGHADRHPEAGAIGPQVVDETGRRQESYFAFPTLRDLLFSALYLYKLMPRSRWFGRGRLGHLDPQQVQQVEAISGCCFLVRKEALERVGPLDERYFMYVEEVDLCYRLHRAGYEVHYVPEARVVHSGRGSSRLVSGLMFLEIRRSVIQYFAKYRGRMSAEAARLLLALWLVVRLPYWLYRSLAAQDPETDEAVRFQHHMLGLRYLARPLDQILGARPFEILNHEPNDVSQVRKSSDDS